MNWRRPARTRARARPAQAPRTPKRHPHAGNAPLAVGCAIVTVSDTRDASQDVSGRRAAERLEAAGHRIAARAWVKDDPAAIRRAVRSALRREDVDLVVTTGGTGVAPRDQTPEALAPLMERRLPGFGELFRARSLPQVGAAAWLSRAEAGIARGRLLVVLPGSPKAVDLALIEVLIPELVHVMRLLGRGRS